jgi:SNF2 family DNA or RNA helicase
VFRCHFDDRDIPKREGFRWSLARKQWETSDYKTATRLIQYAGRDVQSDLARRGVEAQGQADASRAKTAEPILGLEFARKGEVLPYQWAGARYLMQHVRSFLADECGLGKSIQSLLAVEAQKALPCLIICPATLKPTWRNEILKWFPGRSVRIVKNGNDTIEMCDYLIINYDIVSKRLAYLSRFAWKAMIADESSALKEAKAQRSEAVKTIAERIPIRYLLSGTPLLNRPKEALSQLEILGQLPAIASSQWKYLTRFCGGEKVKIGWDKQLKKPKYAHNFNGATNTDELHNLLVENCMIRRLKSEVLTELPPLRYVPVTIPLSNAPAYLQAQKEAGNWLKQNPMAGKMNVLARITALRQVAAESKLKGVIQWITDFLESGSKLVVFAHHQQIQYGLLHAFPESARVIAEDSPEERTKNVERFQNDLACRVIICSLTAGGLGITLTAASHVALVELSWTPAALDQAAQRCHRIGQRDAVTCYYLLGEGTIDEEMLSLVESKRQTITSVVDGGETEAQASIVQALGAWLAKQDGELQL